MIRAAEDGRYFEMKKIWIAGFALFVTGSCLGMDLHKREFFHAIKHGAEGMLTLRVLDDEGYPVNAADIQVNFPTPLFPQKETKWITDTNGFCVLKGIATDDIVYSIKKSGYYETRGSYAFSRQKMPMVIDGKWQPWNSTNTVILKPVKNPVPMYVREIDVLIPVLDHPIGFDLKKGDWVSPYGGGVRSDFLISFSKERRAKNDYDLNITLGFLNQGDGIQEIEIENPKNSNLRMPYEASLVGYQTNWISHAGQRPESGYFGTLVSDETKNYFYRVRTVMDENGEIKSALYGKIYGAILFDVRGSETASLMFKYYLNPTPNDQNIEFDPDKNLFGGRDRFAP